MKTLQDYIDKLNSLNFKEMYENDFFLTWEKTDEELEAVWHWFTGIHGMGIVHIQAAAYTRQFFADHKLVSQWFAAKCIKGSGEHGRRISGS